MVAGESKQKMKTKDREKIAVWIDNEDVAKLKQLQKTYHINMSGLIREFIHEGLKSNPSVLRLLKKK